MRKLLIIAVMAAAVVPMALLNLRSVDATHSVITDCQDLQDIQHDLSGSYVLSQNLDCGPSGENFKQTGPGFTPIGGNLPASAPLTSFIGTFDGKGKTIAGLFIDTDVFTGNNQVGLFGRTGPTAVIKDLTVIDANISGRVFVSALVGINEGSLDNVTVTGATVRALRFVGGVAGRNTSSGKITDATAQNVDITALITIRAAMEAGGLVGENRGQILRSSSSGKVFGVGTPGVFTCCVGGLVGGNETATAKISQSFSEATVSGPCRVGGLAGGNALGQIIDSYATGDVSSNKCLGAGGDDIAGLVGLNFGGGATLTNSYSTGLVTPGNPSKSGGAVGENLAGATCTAVFWDTQTSGFLTSACGTGKTTAVMQTESTFTNAGWDFISTWAMRDYPCLQWEPGCGDSDGDGVPDDQDDCPGTPGLPGLQGCPAVFLAIDEDSVDSGNPPNFFSDVDVNDPIAEIGLRDQLPFFAANVGNTITLRTGEVGDEGWFALKSIPDSWAGAGLTADGLRNYLVAGPGLGSADVNGDREALLDKVADVTPLRATGLKLMEGQGVCAVVYDSDISINYDPLNGSLKGANLGTLAFEVVSVTQLTGFSSSSLPEVTVEILDASEICEGPLALFTEAPEPISSSEPFDVVP